MAWSDQARQAALEARRMHAKSSGIANKGTKSSADHLTHSQSTPHTIVSRERTNAEAIVAKYARFPGVKANELARAHQTLAKYANLEARAASAQMRIEEAFKRKYGR